MSRPRGRPLGPHHHKERQSQGRPPAHQPAPRTCCPLATLPSRRLAGEGSALQALQNCQSPGESLSVREAELSWEQLTPTGTKGPSQAKASHPPFPGPHPPTPVSAQSHVVVFKKRNSAPATYLGQVLVPSLHAGLTRFGPGPQHNLSRRGERGSQSSPEGDGTEGSGLPAPGVRGPNGRGCKGQQWKWSRRRMGWAVPCPL